MGDMRPPHCWASIPEGVLENIGEHLCPDDSPCSRLVCKSWLCSLTRSARRLQPLCHNMKHSYEKFSGITLLDLGRCSGLPSSKEIEDLGRFRSLKALVLPKGGHPGRKSMDASFVRALGGLRNLTTLDMSGSWLECGLNSLSSLVKLEKLLMIGCRWASSENRGPIAIPRQLSNLTHLDLSSSLLLASDADLEVLHSMPDIATLSLADCRWVIDKGIAVLKSSLAISDLDLTRTGITDEGMETIAQLCSLTRLKLEGTMISDNGVALLGNCAQLEILNISGCYMVTEEGINQLSNLQSLHILLIEGISYFSTRGLGLLSRLQNLQTLSFDMPQWIADEEVGLLMNSTSLKRISINGCKGTCLLWMLSHPTIKEIKLTNGRLGHDHLQYLSTLGALNTLEISKCEHLSLKAFEKLRCLKNLEHLSLDITHGEFEKHFIAGSICPLINLKQLSLSCEYILDETVADLWRLPQLCNLFLEDCVYLTDVGLALLGMIKKLEYLTIKSPLRTKEEDLPVCMEITEKGLEELTNLNSLRKLVLHGRHSIGARAWGVLNSAPSLREIGISVPPMQHYLDDVMKSFRPSVKVRSYTACIDVVE